MAVNELRESFQRFPLEDTAADVTNGVLGVLDAVEELPKAYGLPRDESATLPFAVPELDGDPLHDHPDLPAVAREDLIDPRLTVGSYRELAEPPSDLPGRAAGPGFHHDGGGDHEYDLVPVEEVTHIDAFTGPQLSFEFTIPEFVEDAISGHITATGTPWSQERFDAPAADISDPAHRSALADRYDAIATGGPVSEVVGRLRQVTEDGDAPDGNGVETTDLGTAGFAVVESEPEAVPSWGGGLVVAQDIDEGDHRLTVNAPGMAPYSEGMTATEGETTLAGRDGDVPLVANRDAVKVAVDAEAGDTLSRVTVEDDFGGPLAEVRPPSDRFGVYVHRGGAYTVDVRDEEGEPGAERVNPGSENRREFVARTGKASLAEYLASLFDETAMQVPALQDGDGGSGGSESDDGNGGSGSDGGGGGSDDGQGSGNDPGGDPDEEVTGLVRALEAVASAAERAAERAESNDAPGADRALETVETRIDAVVSAMENARGDASADLERVVDRRVERARPRLERARSTGKTR